MRGKYNFRFSSELYSPHTIQACDVRLFAVGPFPKSCAVPNVGRQLYTFKPRAVGQCFS